MFPGEIIEVIQTIDMKDNTYLRLADDRGWVFTLHPTNLTPLLTPLEAGEYSYHERNVKFKVDASLVRV